MSTHPRSDVSVSWRQDITHSLERICSVPTKCGPAPRNTAGASPKSTHSSVWPSEERRTMKERKKVEVEEGRGRQEVGRKGVREEQRQGERRGGKGRNEGRREERKGQNGGGKGFPGGEGMARGLGRLHVVGEVEEMVVHMSPVVSENKAAPWYPALSQMVPCSLNSDLQCRDFHLVPKSES